MLSSLSFFIHVFNQRSLSRLLRHTGLLRALVTVEAVRAFTSISVASVGWLRRTGYDERGQRGSARLASTLGVWSVQSAGGDRQALPSFILCLIFEEKKTSFFKSQSLSKAHVSQELVGLWFESVLDFAISPTFRRENGG